MRIIFTIVLIAIFSKTYTTEGNETDSKFKRVVRPINKSISVARNVPKDRAVVTVRQPGWFLQSKRDQVTRVKQNSAALIKANAILRRQLSKAEKQTGNERTRQRIQDAIEKNNRKINNNIILVNDREREIAILEKCMSGNGV